MDRTSLYILSFAFIFRISQTIQLTNFIVRLPIAQFKTLIELPQLVISLSNLDIFKVQSRKLEQRFKLFF
ncbi:hypothetical protein CDG79_32065 [Nostoc sp. 'Peltigera membranacea cyanobiont' 232]|nr:hypothetical protein CDG79_32065 [Nostoc sp. 'Peltigera membranacea cyanobiont' 232]